MTTQTDFIYLNQFKTTLLIRPHIEDLYFCSSVGNNDIFRYACFPELISIS